MPKSLRPQLISLALLLLCAAVEAEAQQTLAPDSPEAQAADVAAAQAWARVPEILARIVPPKFPARDFEVTKYGAVGDGTTDCTAAFRAAIEACHAAGGGRVLVPAGVFSSGAIHLLSNVNLHVTKDATIRFSSDPLKFLPVVFTRYECTEVMNYSPLVYAFEQENIALTGEGTLDGQGSALWQTWKGKWDGDAKRLVEMGNRGVPVAERIFGEGHYLRPNFVQPMRCRNVLIEGVRIVEAPMWVLHPLYCTNVTIRSVTVDTKGANTDGCDPDSCTDVWIKDCNFSDGDDCIAIKSGRDADGRRVNIPCQNLVIQNCIFKAGHGGVTMGSETAGGIRNVFAEDCHFDSPDLEMALRFKTNRARGGFIENIYLRRCAVQTAKVGIHMTLKYGSSGAKDGDADPVVRNIDIRDSTFAGLTKQPIFIEGYSDAVQITDVTIARCTFAVTKKNAVSTFSNVARVQLIGLTGDASAVPAPVVK